MKVKSESQVAQLCLTLSNPMDCSLQGSSVHGICQAQKYWSEVPLPSPMTNLDSILKSRDLALPTKVCLAKAMVFPVIMYGCESWTVKKAAAAAAKLLQSYLTLCNPVDGSPLGSPVSGTLQARTLE